MAEKLMAHLQYKCQMCGEVFNPCGSTINETFKKEFAQVAMTRQNGLLINYTRSHECNDLQLGIAILIGARFWV